MNGDWTWLFLNVAFLPIPFVNQKQWTHWLTTIAALLQQCYKPYFYYIFHCQQQNSLPPSTLTHFLTVWFYGVWIDITIVTPKNWMFHGHRTVSLPPLWDPRFSLCWSSSGSGTVNTCQQIPLFQRNMLSVFRFEVVMLGSGGIYIGLEKGKAEGVGQIRTGIIPLLSTTTSALMMETVCFSEMLVSTDEFTWCQNLEYHNPPSIPWSSTLPALPCCNLWLISTDT